MPKKITENADLMTLWLKLIDSESEEDLEMLESVKEPSITEAVSFIKHMSADEKTRERARLEEKWAHDEASIIGTARREGERKGKAEAIKNLMDNLGLTVMDSMKALGISENDYDMYISMISKKS